MKKIAFLLMILSLAGCSDPGGTSVDKIDGAISSNYKQGGASSGGGGYSQSASHEMLNIAKLALSEGILNSPSEMFSKFPEGLRKEEVAKIIGEIKFMPKERRERDGSFLKFDYDLNTKSIIATYDFYVIYNFPSILSLSQNEFIKAVENIQLDILHEFSHFLGIGKNKESNFTSQLFADYMRRNLTGFFYKCESDKYQFALNPYTRIMLTSKKGINSYPFGGGYAQTDDIYEYLYTNDEWSQQHIYNREHLESDHHMKLIYRYNPTDGSDHIWNDNLRLLLGIPGHESIPDAEEKIYGFHFNKISEETEQVSFIESFIDGDSFSSTYGYYETQLDSSFAFNTKTGSGDFKVNIKLNFDEGRSNKKEIKERRKYDELEINQQIFSCKNNPKAIEVDPFLNFPVKDLTDKNIKKLLDVVYPF